jgi:D-alanyl-D-alanine dipeptidase
MERDMNSSRMMRRLAGVAALAAAAACAPAASAGTVGTAAMAAGQDAAQDPECRMAPGALVNVRSVDPTIHTDVRYATRNNFTGAVLPGYERAVAMLRPDAAAALGRVSARVRPLGLRLVVFDGYRPVRATLGMVEWAERTGNQWVLEQGYVARQSGHNTGRTVDLTLVNAQSGRALQMGTEYDTFSERAHTANASGDVARNRRVLVEAMQAEGFQNYEKEWWHFSIPGPREPLDVPLRCFR